MRGTGSPRRPLLAVVLLCVAVRLAFFIAVQPWDATVEGETILRSDAVGYDALARNLLDLHRFTAGGAPETLRTPLYPAFVALVYGAFGRAPWMVLLAQIGLAALSSALVFASARRIFGARAALAAGLFFALDPALVYSTLTLMSEPLFVLLCALALYAFGLASERHFDASSPGPLAAAAFALGLATWVRPIALYVPGAIALFTLVWQRGDLRRALANAALFCAVFAATLAPWAARNLAVAGHFAFSSSGAYNLLVLDVSPMEMERRRERMEVVKPALLAEADARMAADGLHPETASGFERGRYQSRLALQYIAERPLTFAKYYAFGIFTSFANLGTRGYADWLGLRDLDDDRFDLRAHPNPFDLLRAALAHKSAAELWIGMFCAGFLLAFYPSIAIGALSLRGRSEKERALLWLCAALTVYFVGLTGPAGLARFKLAATPFLDVLAGAGAARLTGRLKLAHRPPTTYETHGEG
jgi:4-amino-4-deoxy-L-arabinose transferase-like glycosyltransferase